jgi:hypothetical protein
MVSHPLERAARIGKSSSLEKRAGTHVLDTGRGSATALLLPKGKKGSDRTCIRWTAESADKSTLNRKDSHLPGRATFTGLI